MKDENLKILREKVDQLESKVSSLQNQLEQSVNWYAKCIDKLQTIIYKIESQVNNGRF